MMLNVEKYVEGRPAKAETTGGEGGSLRKSFLSEGFGLISVTTKDSRAHS